MSTTTVEVTITRTADEVVVSGPGGRTTLGSWSFMCVPPAADGTPRTGPATEVPDEVVLEALFGDQHIYSNDPAPRVGISAYLGERRYRVTVTR